MQNPKNIVLIKKNINSLSQFEQLFVDFEVYIEGELEIEPFISWSNDFAASYWYLKYSLEVGNERIIDEEYKDFYLERNLNFICLTLTDHVNFKLKCVDGKWVFEIYTENNKKINSVIENLNI